MAKPPDPLPSTAPTILSLPHLCLTKIAHILKDADLEGSLASLITTCKAFREVGRKILYEKIELKQGVNVVAVFDETGDSMALVKHLRIRQRNAKELLHLLSSHSHLIKPSSSSQSSYPTGLQTWSKLSLFTTLTTLHIELEATPLTLPLLFLPPSPLCFPHVQTLSLISSMREIDPPLHTPTPSTDLAAQFPMLESFAFRGRYMVLRRLQEQVKGQVLGLKRVELKVDGTEEGRGDALARFVRGLGGGVEKVELEFAYAGKPFEVYPIVDLSPLHDLTSLQTLRLTFEQLHTTLTPSSLGPLLPTPLFPLLPSTPSTSAIKRNIPIPSYSDILHLVTNLAKKNPGLREVGWEMVTMDEGDWGVGKKCWMFAVERKEAEVLVERVGREQGE